MDTRQKDILMLIRAGVTQQKIVLGDHFSMKELLPVIKWHNIAALCYYGALACELDSSSAEMQALFQKTCQYIALSEKQKFEIQKILSAFDENQIDYMPLKGILLKNLYPHAEMRMMGDADILIKTEQYETIRDIMLQLSYQQAIECDHVFEWEKNGIHIELHRRLIPSHDRDFYSYFGDGWSFAKERENTRYFMKHEDEFVFLLAHYAKHYRDGGVGIKQTVDLWVFLNHYSDLDTAYIEEKAKELSLFDFYINVKQLLKVWFEDGEPNDVTELMTNIIFKSGVFGKHSTRVLSNEVKVQSETGKKSGRLGSFLFKAFLPYSNMCEKYPFLKKVPFLLPFLWVYRWIEAILFKRKAVKTAMKDVQLMHDEHVEAYRQELKAVGLSFHFDE